MIVSRSRHWKAWMRRGLLLLPLLGLVAVLAWLIWLLSLLRGAFAEPAEVRGLGWIALVALAVYGLSHVLRIVRLALIIADYRVGLRNLATFHVFSSAVGLALPFKLGELFRIAELPNLASGGLLRSIAIVWIERIFDVAMILVLIGLALLGVSGSIQPFLPVFAASLAFMVISGLVVFVAPDSLRRSAIYMIRRYDSPRSVAALRFIAYARAALGEVPRMLRGRYSSILSITVLIWICELTTFTLLVQPAVAGGWPLTGLLAFVSDITAGGTMAGLVMSGPPRLTNYLLFTQLPLAVAGFGAGLYYLSRRWRWAGRRSSPVIPSRV